MVFTTEDRKKEARIKRELDELTEEIKAIRGHQEQLETKLKQGTELDWVEIRDLKKKWAKAERQINTKIRARDRRAQLVMEFN